MTLRLNEVATPSPLPAIGKDNIFIGTDGRVRKQDSSGNVWPLAEIVMGALSTDYTLTNGTAAQKAFNIGTNGAIALPIATSYLLEALYMITNTGTTSHTWATLFAASNGLTLTALDYEIIARSGITSQLTLTAESSASQSNGSTTPPTTALVATTASVSATENVLIDIRGILRVNAGGNLIPQVQLSAAPGGTQKMLRGSYIKLTPFGSNTATNLGSWS